MFRAVFPGLAGRSVRLVCQLTDKIESSSTLRVVWQRQKVARLSESFGTLNTTRRVELQTFADADRTISPQHDMVKHIDPQQLSGFG